MRVALPPGVAGARGGKVATLCLLEHSSLRRNAEDREVRRRGEYSGVVVMIACTFLPYLRENHTSCVRVKRKQ